MSLSINLTLVVQMIHFMIAYCIINYLFLKPGYKMVVSDAYRVKRVTNRIVAWQELIAHKRSYKLTRWKLFRDYFYKQKPQVLAPFTPDAGKHRHATVVDLTPSEREKLASEISEALYEKIVP